MIVQMDDMSAPSSREPAQRLYDKALESVEEALIRLEELLQWRHVSSSNSGKEHLKAACSDLEKIRKLKKGAEFLEASFRAKAASLQQDMGSVFSTKWVGMFALFYRNFITPSRTFS